MNPRETKRFINNFIIASEIYSGDERVKPKELLLVQALKTRWNDVYRSMSSYESFRQEIKKYLPMSAENRENDLKNRKDLPFEYKDILEDILTKPELIVFWEFLKEEKDTLFSIKDWNIYRRAADSVKEDLTQTNIPSYTEDANSWVSKGKDLEKSEKYDEAIKYYESYRNGSKLWICLA